ncbi:hypothetical protein KFL_000120540 [Klebsormidium nitens]|uniref:ASPIC/UnbV domain-containing protein n=1 Tax=Klebsormidium nitens TaxID=105231 RepID=A0A1Y1HRE6_KLENI|nr:hypothetical protein KFL_000120540 [Klebsormidium nitens]|eukprot:GAQ78408.1 hypothetical protein KFL_000120540 [Klebsormidium nitens]
MPATTVGTPQTLKARKAAAAQRDPGDQQATLVSDAKETSPNHFSRRCIYVFLSIFAPLLLALMAATACACLATPSIRANLCGGAFLQASTTPPFWRGPANPSSKSWNISLNWRLFQNLLSPPNLKDQRASVNSRSPIMASSQPAAGATSAAVSGATRRGFFADVSNLIEENPSKLHYGVAAVNFDGDGQDELFVCGFGGAENQLLKWRDGKLVNVARGTPLADPERQAIGVAAGDFDGDGQEEVYVLNTDTFGGRKKLTDRLFSRDASGEVTDLFSIPRNMDEANMVAGRSVAAVDRKGSGKYGFFVANYGGIMKLFEASADGFVVDQARAAGLQMYPTGGRALVSAPIVSHSAMDIFAGNEGGPNFLFVNHNGVYSEAAGAYGLMDTEENCRGVALLDVDGTGQLGIATGNWQGPHRLFSRDGGGPVGGAASLGYTDGEAGGFKDRAPEAMARPSAIRTVIAADFDNDGYEELFFNNIGSANRLFRQDGPGNWVSVDLGDAEEPGGLGTGAAVADIDGDGRLELLVSHGELRPQPLSLFRSPENDNAWLRVRPLTKQGAPARGATVTLTDSNGRVQVRAIDAGSGYLCQMEPVAHFGLGALKAAVDIQVRWPDGSTVQLDGVDPCQVIKVPHV